MDQEGRARKQEGQCARSRKAVVIVNNVSSMGACNPIALALLCTDMRPERCMEERGGICLGAVRSVTGRGRGGHVATLDQPRLRGEPQGESPQTPDVAQLKQIVLRPILQHSNQTIAPIDRTSDPAPQGDMESLRCGGTIVP
jgi:hypothetical protein